MTRYSSKQLAQEAKRCVVDFRKERNDRHAKLEDWFIILSQDTNPCLAVVIRCSETIDTPTGKYQWNVAS